MLHTFRSSDRFRTHLERALANIKAELDAGQLSTLGAERLSHVVSECEERGGSKPRFRLRNEDDGSHYIFKQCEPALAAAEEAAYELLRFGGRPCVPARAMQLDVDGSGPVPGLLKPFVTFEVQKELPPDTTTWTLEQQAVMLLGHAWEWFLDNLDTNTSQYALLGPLELPINIDWDRSFFSGGRSEMSRFAKYRPTLPNARTFLYADYVAGKIKLPLWLLAAEARRIRRLPRARVRAIASDYAAVRFEDQAEREQFVRRMLIRQRNIESEVGAFMRALWAERRKLQMPPESLRDALEHRLLLLWADWQLVLNAVLRGPIGTYARRVLSFIRGYRARPAIPLSPDLPNAKLRS
jgi:hypothetical protein